MRKTKAGGGWQAIFYTVEKALEVGPWRLWRKMRSKNACKTCAVGMGGQRGGMVNEAGHFPEVCKKSLQAQAADMKGSIEPGFFAARDLTNLLQLTPKQAEDAGRIIFPLVLEPGKTNLRPLGWDSALDAIANQLKAVQPERVAFYMSGRSSNEAAFLLQSFARVFGCNHVMNCSYYCHQASGVALKLSLGSGTATINLEDMDKCDLVVLLGANPASNHPRLMTKLSELRARHGKVIVVNPIRESGLERFHVPSKPLSLLFGSSIASMYIQPLAGGDCALLIGVLKALIEFGRVQQHFLSEYTKGYEEVLTDAAQFEWDSIVALSGVSKVQILEMANAIADAKSVIFAWAMGLTHHEGGVENILALTNVALATGNIGRPGAGLLPIRGHSNVQGIGSVGVAPALHDAVRQSLETAYGKKFSTDPGYDTYEMMEAAEQGKIDLLFCLGGNLWGSNPDSDWASRAMQKVTTVVYLSTKLNPGHFHGRGQTTIILPVLARDEETQATTQESMFNFVRLSEGGETNVKGQLRAESEIICDLANRVLGTDPVDWNKLKDHKEVRKLIAQCIPGWAEIASIDEKKNEFTIAGRVFHTPSFPTVDGKAVLQRVPLTGPAMDKSALRLVTLRSEGQFNTVVYEEADIYRGIPHRHCILISDDDGTTLGVKDGQRVRVRGEAGSLENVEVVYGNIRPGVAAMFYPESNILIKGKIDPRSKTPAFKSNPVWIEAL